uniref:CSON010768 protein n=1 Tax=Culicoides sonorensis TaxID=179676 RepID=A0A336M260_CULSO
MEVDEDNICRYCDKTFKNAVIRKRHEKVHTDQAYQCNICSKRIAQKSHWIEHMKKVHLVPAAELQPDTPVIEVIPAPVRDESPPPSEEHFNFIDGKYQCNICPKTFLTISTIRRHNRYHTNPFICDYCGFKSGSKWHLRDHLMGHTRLIDPNQKLVKGRKDSIRKKSSRIFCNECPRYFYSDHDLKGHQRRRHTLTIDKGSDLGRLFEMFGHEKEISDKSEGLAFVGFSNEIEDRLITEVFVKEELVNEEYLDTEFCDQLEGGEVGLYMCSCGISFPKFLDLAHHESTSHPESFKETVESMKDLILKLLCVKESLDDTFEEPTKFETDDFKHCNDTSFNNNDRKEELSDKDLISRNINIECNFCKTEITALFYDTHLFQNHPSEDHVDAKRGQQKYSCNCCAKKFNNLLACVKHIRSADHQLQGTDCDICTMDNFKSLLELNNHRAEAHQNKQQPSCNECEKNFANNRLLKFHMLKHKGLKASRCKMCGCKFLSQEELDRHVVVHENEPTLVCPTCGLEFKGREPLRQHTKNRHSSCKPRSSDVEIMCNICGLLCKGKERLKRHFQRVHMERRLDIECPYCPKKFDSKHDLAKHSATHSKEPKYFCNECDKGFTRKQSLNRHIRVHDDSSKIYTCTFCPKSFRSVSNQKRHIISHTGEKNQFCTECDATYADRSCLNKHMERTHGHSLPGYNKLSTIVKV